MFCALTMKDDEWFFRTLAAVAVNEETSTHLRIPPAFRLQEEERGSRLLASKGTSLGLRRPSVIVQEPNHGPKPKRPHPGSLLSFGCRVLLLATRCAHRAFGRTTRLLSC